MIRIAVESGQKRGASVESSSEVLRIGRADGNDLLLPDDHVSGDHARVQIAARPLGTPRSEIDERHGRRAWQRAARVEADPFQLATGDVIELGHGAQGVRLVVTVSTKKTIAPRRSSRFAASTTSRPRRARSNKTRRAFARSTKRRSASAPRTISSDVLVAIADAVLALVPRATHVTIILRDDDVERPPRASPATCR